MHSPGQTTSVQMWRSAKLPIAGPFTTFMETKDVVEKPCGISNLLVAAGTKLVWKNPFATFY